ncbi:hypothetical protein EVAR_65410_1 [Eumeta japonica]|uniref:Uncharacterized protein n=1 Tax=Eumeta variegata TaxID=151549 RepID=A0A4C1ZSZ6_EUMVA|nr:hypothetical protein EVAR_65410_1 [Eumeta japonica]
MPSRRVAHTGDARRPAGRADTAQICRSAGYDIEGHPPRAPSPPYKSSVLEGRSRILFYTDWLSEIATCEVILRSIPVWNWDCEQDPNMVQERENETGIGTRIQIETEIRNKRKIAIETEREDDIGIETATEIGREPGLRVDRSGSIVFTSMFITVNFLRRNVSGKIGCERDRS